MYIVKRVYLVMQSSKENSFEYIRDIFEIYTIHVEQFRSTGDNFHYLTQYCPLTRSWLDGMCINLRLFAKSVNLAFTDNYWTLKYEILSERQGCSENGEMHMSKKPMEAIVWCDLNIV